MTTYNGPRQLREQKDFDRLTAELVRAQPPTKRSVIRWREDVPVPLDSIVIVFTPVAGGSLVLPRPESRDDGRTVIVAVAEGSGPLTVECPRPEEAAERKELVQPGAYTFYAIDRVYYVDTAIVGSVPAEAVAVALESDGTSVLGKFDAGPGDVAPIVASVDDTVLVRENGTVGFSQISPNMLADDSVTAGKLADDSVTDAKIRESVGCSVIGRSANTLGNPADITASTNDRVLARQSNALTFAQVSTGMLADDSVTDAKIRESAGCSVIGRSASTGGNPADITASTNDRVLARQSNALTFAQVSSAMIATNAVGNNEIRQGLGCSVIGRASSVGGNVDDIQTISNGTVLARTGDMLQFVQVDETMLDSESVTSTKIATNAVKRASAHFGDFGKYLCSVTKSSNQSVTSGAGFVAITWDTELIDREGMHSTSSLTARIQIPAAGVYAIAWDVYASGAAGTVRVRRDGTTQITDDYPVADGVVDSRFVVRNFSSSGYIELMYDAIGATGTLSGPSCGLTVLSLDL